MKTGLGLILLVAMAGCGVETVGTAATAAAMKKQALEQGRGNADKVEQQVQALNQLTAQRAAQAEQAGK
ncbi:hypothetical protein [Dechloromonas sp. HYN0024]|uniref:hypothetical protein n=1 Tax=Dechloromonas sp. HYN0024 TaxID=2231055 RepID=UPI000E43675C|nr:hypothetical protein [Dechloromonas sp. HYN0024]AXS80094.1 hypothetical protein HYN24_08735 [Dechloromonas sp. HYN0024]